jgi:hypothetical protein
MARFETMERRAEELRAQVRAEIDRLWPAGPPANLALAFLAAAGRERDEFECVELAGEVLEWVEKKRPGTPCSMVWIQRYGASLLPACGGNAWQHHAVPLVAGLVHCAWHPEWVLPPEEYCRRAFPGQMLRVELTNCGTEE